MSQNPQNATETIRHLQSEIQQELHEMQELERELKSKIDEASKFKMEIPQLQRKLEEEKHALYVDEVDVTKLHAQLEKIKREKLALQNNLSIIQKSFQEDLRKMNVKPR